MSMNKFDFLNVSTYKKRLLCLRADECQYLEIVKRITVDYIPDHDQFIEVVDTELSKGLYDILWEAKKLIDRGVVLNPYDFYIDGYLQLRKDSVKSAPYLDKDHIIMNGIIVETTSFICPENQHISYTLLINLIDANFLTKRQESKAINNKKQ